MKENILGTEKKPYYMTTDKHKHDKLLYNPDTFTMGFWERHNSILDAISYDIDKKYNRCIYRKKDIIRYELHMDGLYLNGVGSCEGELIFYGKR